MTMAWLQNLIGLVEGILFCGMFYCLVRSVRLADWIPDSLKRLPIPVRLVLCSLTVFLALLCVPKSDQVATGFISPLPTGAVAQQDSAPDNAVQGVSDAFRFLDIDVATNGTVSLIAHRPTEAANVAQDVVVVATTNLAAQSWFALTNATFAVGETNLVVVLSTNFLGTCAITNRGFFAFCDAGDTDSDGLDDWHERYNLNTDPTLVDSDGDGVSDGVEVTQGTNPRLRDTDGDGYGDAGDPDPCMANSWNDMNGDGWPDDWFEVWNNCTQMLAYQSPTGSYGYSLEALPVSGIDPNSYASTNGVVTQKLIPPSIVAHEIVPAGFSFVRTAGSYGARVTNILSRTFAISRTNRWQQCFLSSCPDCGTDWQARDIALGDPLGVSWSGFSVTSLETLSCFRVNFAEFPVTSVPVSLWATGNEPLLSRPLYLLEWAPRILRYDDPSAPDASATGLVRDGGLLGYAVRRSGSDAAFRLPFVIDRSDCPVGDAYETGLDEDFQLSPSDDLVLSNSTFFATNACVVSLPTVGTNTPERLYFYDLEVSYDDAVAAGPRASPFAAPYPLASASLREAFHNGCEHTDATTATVRIRPDHPDVRLGVGLNAADLQPEVTIRAGESAVPFFDGLPDWAGRFTLTNAPPERWPCLPSEADEPEEADDCACGTLADNLDATRPRLRIPLGEPSVGAVSGFVWLDLSESSSVSLNSVNILAGAGVTSATNALTGAITVTAAAPQGRTVLATNAVCGVALAIFNASGREEGRWEASRTADGFRIRHLTVAGNATEDRSYDLAADDSVGTLHIPASARVGSTAPDAVTAARDELTGATRIRAAWRTTVRGVAFDTDVYAETRGPDGAVVESVMSEYDRIGTGDASVRRLTRRVGFDLEGPVSERRLYVADDANPQCNGRLRAVTSNRRAWAWYDYDALGREICRIEQLDGSSFPETLSEISTNAPLASAARITATSYEPAADDSCHANDRDLPRRVETFVCQANPGGTIHEPIKTQTETWRYMRSVDAQGVPLRTVVHTHGLGDLVASSTTTAYPDDHAVPQDLRGRVVSETDEDGVTTATTFARGTWDAATRTFAPTGETHLRVVTRRTHGAAQAPTYTVRVETAAHRLVVDVATRLTADDAELDWTSSIYDDVDRLRLVRYSDGTFEANAYSCCRLLARTDRRGRTTRRSATTGTDKLYWADEEVGFAECATNRAFRVTRHFCDAFGRETNTVVSLETAPGAAAAQREPSDAGPVTRTRTTFAADGSGNSLTEDARGRMTMRRVDYGGAFIERGECVLTNGVEVVRTKNLSFFGGDSWQRREWGGAAFTETWRTDEYAADGTRRSVVRTDSPDGGLVTSCVETFDALGRLVRIEAPGANGSTVVTSNVYDGASGRLMSSTTTGHPPVTYGYDAMGTRVRTTRDERSVLDDTSYETICGEVHRVTSRARLTGAVTNSVTWRKERLTGLGDARRSWTATRDASGRITVEESSVDPSTGLVTETRRTERETPVVTVSRMGLSVARTDLNERTETVYDGNGRAVRVCHVDPHSDATNRVETFAYDISGNTVGVDTNLMDGRVPTTRFAYDALNRRIAETNALGLVTVTTYDGLGRLVRTGGDTYPRTFAFDTQGRKTVSRTTRDDGVTWDETAWQYDFATGLCTNKIYADGSQVARAFTDDGRVMRTTWARGAWREHAYNERGLVGGTTYSDPNTPFVVYLYADSGRVSSASQFNGTSYSYAYDERLLTTNETVAVGTDVYSILRSYDGYRRDLETFVMSANVRHAATTRHYDDENRVSGYALTNSTGRALSVTFAYDGSYLTNTVYTLPNGGRFVLQLTREPARKELVTQRAYTINGQPVYSCSTDYDLLGRPTNAVDSISCAWNWLYNRRSELVGATIGTNRYGYAYDSIGNRQWASANAVTNAYVANNLNQYTSILCASAPLREPSYDADGNLTNDCVFAYAYDAENRLVSAYPLAPARDSLAVENGYDHRHRRVRKIVKRYNGVAWTVAETHTFVWDGNSIVLERVVHANGATQTIEYFWGPDKSGTEQGAGGVGGLLAVSKNGVFHIPCYDHNGNIVCYLSETGSLSAEYVYDPYGNVIETSGTMPTSLNFGFSTKYHDRETNMIAYQRRFYRPDLGRWLNRDPIEEDGGENLYAFCKNNSISAYDKDGCAYFASRPLDVPVLRNLGITVNFDWMDDRNVAILHEQLFFEDGGIPTNQGYFDDGLVRSDSVEIRYNSPHSRGWNDCIMRKAVAAVRPRPYSLLGDKDNGLAKYNCQDWAEEVRRAYFVIQSGGVYHPWGYMEMRSR